MSDLTPGAALAWRIGANEAAVGKQALITPSHFLIGVLSLEKLVQEPSPPADFPPGLVSAAREESDRIEAVLSGMGVSAAELRRALREALGSGQHEHAGKAISRSPALKAAFRRATALVPQLPVGCLALVAAIAAEPDAALERALTSLRASPLVLRQRALELMSAGLPEARARDESPREPEQTESSTPVLERYGRDLTRLASEGKLGPIVGRRAELLQVLQVLARNTKNNPLLVGDAGVGKTAIVEALAIRVAAGKDPAVLEGKRILELNLGALMGGTQFRGELEKRVTQLLDEARTHPEVYVFIDELHTIVGTGQVGTSGLDLANLIKPALARGELRLIGATTIAEYRQYVEEDAALERRFERIDVREPSRDETIEILRGLRSRFEQHHEVHIADEALVAAVDLAVRFDPDHHLPDKAVDLVDRAASRTRVPMLSMPAPGKRRARAPAREPVPRTGHVLARTVAEVLAEKRELPLEIVLAGMAQGSAGQRLLELDAFLRSRIVGQDEALARVAARVRLAHSGLAQRSGPLAVMLFLGPTGVGKTETARLLAEFLFGSAAALTRIDMSEMQEEHSVSKLIGAPPGYVGHDEEGQLTRQLRTRPYGVVLLDEIEKAHPNVFDLFLQVFDAGRITDAKGRTADARHAIFVMTSNLGGWEAKARMGFSGSEAAPALAPTLPALEMLRHFFRAEFLSRIDEQIVFRPLSAADLERIAKPIFASLAAALEHQHDVALRVTPQALAFLVERGSSAGQGARELRRTVEQLVQVPLSSLVLSGKIKKHRAWAVVYDEAGLCVVPDAQRV